MTRRKSQERACGCLDHRENAETTYGSHTFSREEEDRDDGYTYWRARCSCGFYGGWYTQSPWVSYHGWLRHIERVRIKDHPGRRPPDAGREKKEKYMALKKASEAVPTGDWLDLKELAQERAAVVFTVRGKEPAKDFGNGVVEPVVADVIVLTGKHAGEYHPKERILAAGVRNKLTEIGDSVVGRMGLYGARKNPGLEAEEPGDIELAEAALAKYANSNGNGAAKGKAAAAVGSDEDPPF